MAELSQVLMICFASCALQCIVTCFGGIASNSTPNKDTKNILNSCTSCINCIICIVAIYFMFK